MLRCKISLNNVISTTISIQYLGGYNIALLAVTLVGCEEDLSLFLSPPLSPPEM